MIWLGRKAAEAGLGLKRGKMRIILELNSTTYRDVCTHEERTIGDMLFIVIIFVFRSISVLMLFLGKNNFSINCGRLIVSVFSQLHQLSLSSPLRKCIST